MEEPFSLVNAINYWHFYCGRKGKKERKKKVRKKCSYGYS